MKRFKAYIAANKLLLGQALVPVMMIASNLALVAVILGGALAAIDKKSEDWPVFRGNALQNGVASSGLPDHLDIRWTFKTKDSIEAAAAIANGIAYVASTDEHLYAIDLKTGKERWNFKAGPFRVAPSLYEGAVYIGDADGVFFCLDATSGKPRWKFNTESEITSAANFANQTVLFGAGDETLYCLNRDGQKLWTFKVPGGPVLASPAIVGNQTFVSGCDSALHVIDLTNGKEQRSVPLDGQTGATPAVIGDRLYVGTMTNQVLAIDWKKGEVLWRFEAPRRQQPFYASAAVTDDLVVTASRDKCVYALDRKSGKQVWSFATRDKVDSSPVIVGPKVLVGSLDGNLYCLDLARGTELAQYKLGKGISASPAIGGNALVIGTTDGTVYCLGSRQ